MESIQIFPGAFHYPGFLSIEQQEQLLDYYLSYQNEFTTPQLKNGSLMNLQTLCFGRHWNASDNRYYSFGVNTPNSKINPLPDLLQLLATQASEFHFPQFTNFDLGIVNYYTKYGRLGMHRDNAETEETLLSGHPVVSFSIGAAAEFRMGGKNYNDPVKNVILNSGDAFVFGGAARLRYHGIGKILKSKSPPFDNFLHGGRLNFTIRKL